MSNLIPITRIYDIYPKYTYSEDVKKFMDEIVDIKRVEVPITKRIEYGTDGNPYEMSITNGKEYEEVTPVQSAHWTLYRDYENMIDYPQCDNCGAVIKLPLPIDNLNFCPSCGRKMEKENENACL